MISPRLTDVARARLDSISFFLAIYVLCAVLFRWVWNVLARDFAWMPRLTFKKSLAVLVVAAVVIGAVMGTRSTPTTTTSTSASSAALSSSSSSD